MMDEEPGGQARFGDEVSRMLQARALRHPDHTDPVGLTRGHLKAARQRRRTMLGATTTLAVTGGALFGFYAAHSPGSAEKTSGANRPVAAAADYTGAATCPANAKVPIDIPRSATTAQVANALLAADVVKSAQAYVNAANQNKESSGIVAGTYAICPRISAANALTELLKRSNLSNASQIIVTSHEWSRDVIASLIDKRKWKQADFDAAIKNNTIGLPAWSVDTTNHAFTVEGMLEPGTYTITSSDTPQSILSQMVASRMAFLKKIDFEADAAKLFCGTAKCTPEQVLTVASIAEGEVTDQADGSRVAEGVYQRLRDDHYLGIDSTALYYIGHLPAGKPPTAQQVQDPNNPYSTYAPHHGLPPTPVYATSDDMIKAALAPTHEGNYYWCVRATGTEFFKKSQESGFENACATK